MTNYVVMKEDDCITASDVLRKVCDSVSMEFSIVESIELVITWLDCGGCDLDKMLVQMVDNSADLCDEVYGAIGEGLRV